MDIIRIIVLQYKQYTKLFNQFLKKLPLIYTYFSMYHEYRYFNEVTYTYSFFLHPFKNFVIHTHVHATLNKKYNRLRFIETDMAKVL